MRDLQLCCCWDCSFFFFINPYFLFSSSVLFSLLKLIRPIPITTGMIIVIVREKIAVAETVVIAAVVVVVVVVVVTATFNGTIINMVIIANLWVLLGLR